MTGFTTTEYTEYTKKILCNSYTHQKDENVRVLLVSFIVRLDHKVHVVSKFKTGFTTTEYTEYTKKDFVILILIEELRMFVCF